MKPLHKVITRYIVFISKVYSPYISSPRSSRIIWESPGYKPIFPFSHMQQFHEHFWHEGNRFSQAGKTIWTELLYKKTFQSYMVKPAGHNRPYSRSSCPILNETLAYGSLNLRHTVCTTESVQSTWLVHFLFQLIFGILEGNFWNIWCTFVVESVKLYF